MNSPHYKVQARASSSKILQQDATCPVRHTTIMDQQPQGGHQDELQEEEEEEEVPFAW
jgi:hypothetical protein